MELAELSDIRALRHDALEGWDSVQLIPPS